MKQHVLFAGALFSLLLLFGCSQKEKNADALLFEAVARVDSGEWDKALACANHALELAPENADALILRSIAAERTGRRDLALDSALLAVKINPENFMAQYTLGRLYAADPSRLSDAATPLLNALKLREGDRNTLVLLVNVSSALNSDRTLNYLSELALADRAIAETAEYQNQLGLAYAKKRDLRHAEAAFVSAYKLAPETPQIVLNLALFADNYYNQPQKSLHFYREYLRLAKSNPELAASCAEVNARIRQITQ